MTGIELGDTPKTNFGGLGLGLEDAVLEHILRLLRCVCNAGKRLKYY